MSSIPSRRISCLWSGEISQIAEALGATAKEASALAIIFDMEGFGGLECDPHFTSSQLVRAELARLRALGRPHETVIFG